MTNRYAAIILLIMGSAFSANTSAASFDCKKASHPSELLICSDTELGKMDEIITSSYKKLLDQVTPDRKEATKAKQLIWLKTRNTQCKDVLACIEVHAQRIIELKRLTNSDMVSKAITESQTMNDLVVDHDFRVALTSSPA